MIVRRVMSVFRAGGASAVLRAVVRRVRMPHARCFPRCRRVTEHRIGIEIGGPSPLFAGGGLIPVYRFARRIDNVNFASKTLWEDITQVGDKFVFNSRKAPGRQIVAEGANLSEISSDTYDFVLSSHMLEHTANPLGTLVGWKRLLKPGGVLILVVPARDGTFDHRRQVTTMSHLIKDFEMNVGEDDMTHLAEVLQLHDISRDPGVTDLHAFRERAMRNPEVRSLHHHVFDTRLAAAAVQYAGFELAEVEPLLPYHIVVLATKPNADGVVRQSDSNALREALRKSPFPSDRRSL